MKRLVLSMAAGVLCLAAAERKVDPAFLHRFVPSVEARQSDITTSTCRYKPLFGAGDSDTSIVHGVARFGEVLIDPGGSCKSVSYPAEEQAYVIIAGQGTLRHGAEQSPVKPHDFFYIPAGTDHALSNSSNAPMSVYIMGYKLPPGAANKSDKVQIANFDEIKKQTVGGHPDSVVYQLMMGDTKSKRDRIAAGHVLISLYVMEFKPGGTNFPHHHDTAEEIYVLLDGTGDMVAGGGMDGIEGRHPAKPGDAYFFRLNCTVGFYNSDAGPAHMLAVRSVYPRHEPEE